MIAAAPRPDRQDQALDRALDEDASDREGSGERDEEPDDDDEEAAARRLVERREGGLARQARADIEPAGRRHRQVAEDAPRAEVVDELEGRGLVGVDQPLVLVGDALAERVRARRLAQDDGAVAVRDRDLGALDDAALLQALAQPADVEMGDDGAAELALRRERDRHRQRRLVGAGKRREHADGEALAAEHVAEIAAGVVALGVAPGRRLAGDPSADVEHRQRDEVRQAALQRRKIGRAGGALALDDARRMGDGAEEILDPLEDAVDLGAGLARHAQRHLPDLGLAGAAQRELVMRQDDERRQHRNGGEEDKALRQREAGRGAAARKPAAGARERGPEERRKPRHGVQARAQPPQQRPGNITPPERSSRQIPNSRGVRRSNRRQVAQCDGDRAGEDGPREGRARPGKSASALPAGHSRPVDRCGSPGGA